MEQLLTGYFTGQGNSGFRLLRCLKDQGDTLERCGYGGVGHYYWALAADEGSITWVSDVDYLIHWAPLEEFDLPSDCKLPTALPVLPPQPD